MSAEWVDHTGELELHVRAATPEAVFAEASAALGGVLGEGGDGEPVRRRLQVRARDLPALLADWLAELAWLAENESLIPERIDDVRVRDSAVEATVTARSGSASQLVKAVTYHGLRCEREGDAWRASVVLDV